MSAARRKSRDFVVRALYQWQLGGHSVEELLEQFTSKKGFTQCDQSYFRTVLPAAIDNAARLDATIARHAARGLEQLDAVGRAVLLLGLTELEQRRDVPVKVVINEAIELAKRYGPADSYRFVNAVLDKSAKELASDGAATG